MTGRKRDLIPLWFAAIACIAICFATSTSTCRGEGLDTSGWRASTETRTAENLWAWSPAAPHHQSVVQVHTRSTTAAGSGVYVSHGDLVGVLTARHVANGAQTTCTFSDGVEETGDVIYDKNGHDLAFVTVKHSTIPPLPVGLNSPGRGTRVEFVSYGGPGERLRHFWGATEGGGNYQVVVVSGDSGCPVLDDEHRVVAIVTAGRSETLDTSWGVYRGGRAVPLGVLRDFCDRISTMLHRGGGRDHCHPDGRGGGDCNPDRRGGGSDYMFPPKQGNLPGPDDKPDKPSPSPQDSRDGLEEILAKFAKMQATLDGLMSQMGKKDAPEAPREPPPAPEATPPPNDVDPPDPPPVVGPEPASPIVGPEPAVVTNLPPEKKSSGIPWASLLGLAVPVAAGAAGVGLPWAAIAYRGVRLAKRLREKSERGSVATEGPFPDGETAMPRDMREVTELLQLSQLEGRSSLRDAVVGMFAFDILDHAIDSGSAEAEYAQELKRKLLDKLNEVAPLAV